MYYLWIDKVTSKTLSFVSPIANLPAPVELVITEVDDHDKIELISQLIIDISRVLQKLFKYFNGTIISTYLYYCH